MKASGNANRMQDERPKVLLVDDDDVNLMLVSAALQQHGFDITEANNGDEALRLLGGWIPDLVVLDARMPGLDGFETCRRLKANPALAHLPVIFMTGLAIAAVRDALAPAPVLFKPFSRKHLLTAVARAAGRAR